MKVLYDHQIFQMQKFGGISRGFSEIMFRLKDFEYELTVSQSNNVYLKEYNLNVHCDKITKDYLTFLPQVRFKGKRRIYNLLSRYGLIDNADHVNITNSRKVIREGRYDIFHPTYFSTYFVDIIKEKPLVLTVHDLTAELFPKYFSKFDFQIQGRKILIPISSQIIVPSKYTKRKIVECYGIPENKIAVIYWGGLQLQVVKNKNIIDAPYILFVGLRDGYKNFRQFVVDSLSFLQRNKEVKIVCTGKEFTKSELEFLQNYNLLHRVQARFVDSDELKILYAHAMCFVFPSLSEGFGLPILEAFSCGCPVLLINKSCFPEIGGDAAFYYEHYNKESNLSEQLEYIYTLSGEERENIKKRGFARLSDYSWDRAANQYEHIYKSLV